MSQKREPHYNYLRYTPSNLATGDTLVWNGTEWINSPPAAGGPGGAGDVTGAANVGTGEGSLFRDEITGVLNLKTLKQGTNITITNNTSDVTIASAAGTGEANMGANVGSGTGTIFRDKTGVTLNLKTLLAGSNVTLTNNANDVTIAAAAGAAGDITGASNVGSGTGQVFRDEVAGILNLKTLLAGTNITLTNNANDVTIASAAGTGEANTAANVGTGTGTIFRDKTSVTLNLKTILAGTNMTVTNNANDITLASTAGGGSTTLDGLTDVAITSAARGDIIVRDATQYVNKAKGTANQVLKMDSAGTDPAWTSQVSVYDYILYKVGSEYRIYKVDTDTVLSTSTTDCATLINAAIADMDVYGGTIYVKPNKYPCLTTINMHTDDLGLLPSPPTGAGSGGVNIIGNGYGSWLDWSPGSALTDAIHWSINGSKMESLRLVCNSNVTNYIHIVGHASAVAKAGRNAFYHMFFEGPNTDVPITGQRGVFNDASVLPGSYYFKYNDCHFFWLGHGYYAPNAGTTTGFFTDCDFDRCTVGIYVNHTQNFGTNLYFQGDATSGTTGVHLGPNASMNMFDKLIGEFQLTSLPCQTVLLDAGANNWNVATNVFNANHNGTNRQTIVNNGGNRNILSWHSGSGAAETIGNWFGRAYRIAGNSSAPTIGFFNKTPVLQQTGIANIATDTIDATYGTPEQNVLTDLRTKVNSLVTALENLGLLATV